MLAGAKWFSTLYLKCCYWQVALHPNKRGRRCSQSVKGCGGLRSCSLASAVTFEQLMETVLRGLTYELCLMYLDNVIVISRTLQEHLINLQKVLQHFCEAHLKLNPEKCQFFQNKVQYLGHIVSPDGITTDSKKLKTIWEWLTPGNKQKIRSLLGLCTYYRQFSPVLLTLLSH